jgi:hypothetical protein
MAAFGRPAVPLPPDYRHPPSVVVPLAFPFALDGAKVARVPLAPPTLDGLGFLRGEGGLSARSILLVTSPLSLRAIGALRWPDVERLLAEALALLPPDLVVQAEAEDVVEPEDAETRAVPIVADRQSALHDENDVVDQLNLNPGDFAISL